MVDKCDTVPGMIRRSVLLAVAVGCGSHAMPPAGVDGQTGGDGAVADAMPACSGLSAPPADDTWQVMGRAVTVHVPASYTPATRTAIVIDLHGLGSSGSAQALLSHLSAKADAVGFIAISPDGTGTPLGWSSGDCCDPARASGVDDSAFVAALIDAAEARLCVDTHRVYAAGFSNGAYLTHRLACRLADRIAAIGAVAGVLNHDDADCTPARPVPVIQVHGTSDLVVPFGGGGANGSMSVDDSIAAWVTKNQCAAAAPTTFLAHGDATCVNHGGCAAGADVALCTIDGGGHQWPSGISVGPFNGKDSTDMSATDQLWAFFAAHPMP